MSSVDTWKFLAGLGLFLYGISLMEQVTRKMAGRSFKLFLRHYTKSLGKAILGGTVITGIIQSSSVVILMIMSFVSAGIISFRNALGLLIGSNLGTTVDSWFIATVGFKFNLQLYSLPIIAITAIAMFFTEKREKIYNVLGFLFSIGILLLGFGFMKEGAEQLVMRFDISSYANDNLALIVLIGFIITVLIQSSSATVALALTALHSHALSFPAAACIILGSEVGTTIKFLVSTLNANTESKMLAWGDFIFNVFTAASAFLLLHWISIFIQDIVGIKDPLTALVFFQSFINLAAILVFLPVINPFSNLLERIFKKDKQQRTNGFNRNIPPLTELSAFTLQKAGNDILQRVLSFHKKIFQPEMQTGKNKIFPMLRSFTRIHGTTNQEYSAIKETEGDILKYYAGLQKDDLSKDDYEKINQYISAIRQFIHAAKSVHDIHHDLKTFQSSANNFLFQQSFSLQREWQEFETALQLLLNANAGEVKTTLEQLMASATRQFFTDINRIERPLTDHELTELEISTLLNVYHEIFSSKKALLRGISLLKLSANDQPWSLIRGAVIGI